MSIDNDNFPPSPIKSGSFGGNSAEEKLSRVFDILSQSFSRDVSSVEEVQSVVRAFINKYLKLRDRLQEQGEVNEQLTAQLQQSIDQTQFDEADKEQLAANEEELTKKLKQYKKRVIALQQKLNDQEAQNVASQTRVNELELLIEEKDRECARLAEELSKNQQQKQESSENSQEIPQNDAVEETARLFEDIVASQGQEIDDLVHQRDILIDNVRTLDGTVRAAENMMQKLEKEKIEKEEIVSDLKDQIKKIQDKAPALAQEVEQLLPPEIRSKHEGNIADPERFIVSVVEELADSAASHVEEKVIEMPEDVVDKKKYIAVLSHLEGAIKYIQDIGKPGDKAQEACPLGVSDEVRNDLLIQCARLGHFVDENMSQIGLDNMPLHLSIFDQDSCSTAEEQLKQFLEFATKEQLEESPIRELFTLFTAVCEINKMMMNYSEKLKNEVHTHERAPSQPNTDMIRKLQRDNFDLAQWKAVNQERIINATDVLRKITMDDGDTAMDVMAEAVGKRYDETFAELQDLKEKHEKLIQEKTELEEATKATLQEAEEKVLTREISFQEEQKTQEDFSRELEEKVSVLETTNNELKSHIQQSEANYEAALREKTHKLRKAVQAQSEAKKMLSSIQEKTDTIIQENEDLQAANQEMEEMLNAQKEQLIAFAENEKKLRNSRENLKKRIVAAENANKTIILDIKQRNEELQQKYQETVETLQKEFDDNKSELEQLKEDYNKIKEERAQLSKTVTTLRVTERALQLKIKTNNERQALEKSAAEARNNTYMFSLKAQAARQVDEAKAQNEQIRHAIIKLLSQQFNETVEEDASFSDLFNRLDRRLQIYTSDRRILADAIKLRADLNVPADVSLSEQWENEKQERTAIENASLRAKNKQSVIETELTNLKRATGKMSEDAKEAVEWEKWGRSLYKQVNKKSDEIPVQELRYKLAEDVLTAVKDRSTLNRMDLLRAQKKILVNPNINAEYEEGAELSIKALSGVLVFAQRVQGAQGYSISSYK